MRNQLKKTIIPSLITIGNFVSGLSALLLAFRGYLLLAILCVLIGAIFDMLDGMAARKLNAVTPFGKELDSLAGLFHRTADYRGRHNSRDPEPFI